MKLRTQILAVGLTGALFVGIVGAIGLLTTSRLGGDIEKTILAAQALHTSQSADMMHDAVRGDSQLALLGASEGDPARIAEAAKALKAHADTFNQELATLQTLPLSDTSRAALVAAQPVVKRYLEAAEQAIKNASGAKLAAQESANTVQTVFGELETMLAALSDSIEKTGDEQSARAKAGVAQAAVAIGIALLLATTLTVAVALWMARRMSQPMTEAVKTAEQLAHGDLTVDIRSSGNDETVQLLDALVRMRDGFVRIVHDVKSNADSMASASQQIAHGNADLNQRTEEQASALEETAASMEELSSTVKQNADNARQANQLALGASTVAIKGGEVVGQVVQTMKGINDSSKKIADIIGVIDGIAFQTNILALNAAVEAARAGEQGRGFAVVASEVRSLAGRSADAAKEIKSLINASVERVEQGTALVDQAGATMTEVVSSIKRVTDIMGEISAASTEQSAGVAQVGEAVSQMDRATQQNASLVEQSAAAAESLKAQAQALVQAVAVFKLGAGEAVQSAAPVLEPNPTAVERRGPDRAKNVTRPRFGTQAKAGRTAQAATRSAEPAPGRTGTDDEWTSF